jgi:hypothetical protein
MLRRPLVIKTGHNTAAKNYCNCSAGSTPINSKNNAEFLVRGTKMTSFLLGGLILLSPSVVFIAFLFWRAERSVRRYEFGR